MYDKPLEQQRTKRLSRLFNRTVGRVHVNNRRANIGPCERPLLRWKEVLSLPPK